jgi:hypothetical protein
MSGSGLGARAAHVKQFLLQRLPERQSRRPAHLPLEQPTKFELII